MLRVNEFTPLLVDDGQFRPPTRRRSVWQYVLAASLGLGVLSLFQQRNSAPIDVGNVIVSFDETSTSNDADETAFQSTLETFKDPTVDPCVDFYEYACGGWLKAHEIPADRPSIDSSFYVVSESNKATIQKIFDQNPPQIGQLYHSCLKDLEVDTDAVGFIAELIENIHQANSTLELMELAGEMDQSLGISTFFSLFVGADPKDPTTNVIQLAQGGLTLPSREYYLEESKVDAFAALYVDYVTKLFAVGGLDSHNVSEYAEAVLGTETAFAKISLPSAALRNPWTTNTAYPFAEIATRYPLLMAYLNGIYKLEPFPMLHAIIVTPSFFEAQNKLLSDETLLPQLKNYVSFHLIDSFGTILGEYFRRASHEFHGKIHGAGALLPRDQFCVRLTTSFLGDELGKYYMQEVFGPDANAAAQALVTEIEESLKALLLTESWLDKVTYDAAVDKLNKVKNYIGGPDDVPPLPFELQADAFFNNVKSLMQLSAAGTIQAVGKPVDEQAWDMFPSTVNAYYDPSANKMVFPAAILQPPFYSAEHFPVAANFARIGMVMGHELSHGFDDQGRNYDGNGALRSWWTPSVSAEFAEKAQCLAAQYSSFPVVSTEHGHVLGMVNGNLTLGENIADNGGIHLAYEAYQLWKKTFASPRIVPPHETPTPPVEPPAPQPTDTGLPSPGLPIPEADTRAPAQTEPSGEIPVPTVPGAVIPDETSPAPKLPVPEQSPAPTETQPATNAPVVTSSSPTVPTPPNMPDMPPVVPDTLTPPNVPDIPTPPVPTPPPAIVPTPQPKPSDATPDETFKHKHKEKEEDEKNKHQTDDSGKDKKRGKSDSKEGDEKNKHGHEKHDKDDEGNSKKKHDKGGKEDTKEDHHHHEGFDSKDDASKKRKKHSDESKNDESDGHHEKKYRHENEEDDSDHDDSNGKHHHDKTKDEEDNDKHGHGEHESQQGRREDRHRRNEEKEDSGHHGKKHYGHEERDGRNEEGGCRCGKHHHHRDEEEEESGGHKHHKHEKKNHHEEHKGKHHHDRWDSGDEDYDEDRQSKHHRKHHRHGEEREERWEECDCGRGKHERHHHKHKHHWEKDWQLLESKYLFSNGDMTIHTMVQKLARALVQPSDPVADDQLFFTAFAQNWCEKLTPGYAELLRTIDPHSPGKWRVNGPLMNYDKFAEAFSCPVGTPMNPEKKCVIW